MKNQDKIIIAMVVGMLLASLFGPRILQAVDEIQWSGILPHIYTGATGDKAINIAMTASTTGLDVSEESSTTNALYEVSSLTYTTSGTPATGIGPKMSFVTETSAAHNETIGYVGFSVSDGTLDSEDASFVVGNMTAGAAAATKLTVGSTGIVTMAGSAALDNSTSAAILKLTEDTIHSSGWLKYDIITTTAQSYTLASTGKAAYAIQTVGEAATFHLDTDLLTTPGAGCLLTIKTGGANNVVVDTEGAETIDGGNDYTLDASYEAVTLTNDGSNWFILSGYLE